jgi:hypothetical protein
MVRSKEVEDDLLLDVTRCCPRSALGRMGGARPERGPRGRRATSHARNSYKSMTERDCCILIIRDSVRITR